MTVRIPVLSEQLDIGTRVFETGRVVLKKSVEEHDREVTGPALAREEVEVERVPIGRPVEHAEGPRSEGDTTVFPVYEEEVIVTKRLVLKEELHVRVHRRTETAPPQRVRLREEHVEVSRRAGAPDGIDNPDDIGP